MVLVHELLAVIGRVHHRCEEMLILRIPTDDVADGVDRLERRRSTYTSIESTHFGKNIR